MAIKSFVRALAPALSIGLIAGFSASCKGPPVDASCDTYTGELADLLETRGALLPAVPEVEPYPMVVALGDTALQELVRGAADDFSAALEAGPFQIQFSSTAQNITLGAHGDCDTCIKVDFENLKLSIYFGDPGEDDGGEIPLIGNITAAGEMTLGLPISVERSNEVSYLVADFNNLVLRDQDLELSLLSEQAEDLSLDEFKAVKDFLRETITDRLSAEFGKTDLLEMRPWKLGSENVVLAARKVFINSEENTLVIGAATNLDIPVGAGLNTKIALGESDYMSVRFHAELLEKMSQRMLEEGEIPRIYNDNGDPDPNGPISVTIESMDTTDNSNARVDTVFRVWRTDDQYCGWAEAAMPLFMEIEESAQIGVRAGELNVLQGAGVGALVATDEELVEDNKEIVEVFKAELAEQVALTVDYKALDTPNGVFQLFTTGVVSTEEGIEVGLNSLGSLVP